MAEGTRKRIVKKAFILAAIGCIDCSQVWASDAPDNAGCGPQQQLTEANAQSGDVEAQTELGFMYLNGICFEKNNAKAVEKLEKPAEEGNTKAMALLGVAYHRNGLDVEAAKWAKRAAEKGGGGGQSLLAWLFYLGKGVPRDLKLALTFGRLAAEQGMGGGMSLMALLYQNGEAGLPRNAIEADKWYILANRAEPNHKTLKFAREVLETIMSVEEKKEARQRADAWHQTKDTKD